MNADTTRRGTAVREDVTDPSPLTVTKAGRKGDESKHSKDRTAKAFEQKGSRKTESKSGSSKTLERKVSQLDEAGSNQIMMKVTQIATWIPSLT